MSIQNFYAAIQESELARDFQFRVQTLGPFTEKDLVYIRTATLPGKTINNQVVPYMGMNFNVPGSVTYTGSEAWTVSVLCDEGLNIRNKMENWMKEIFDDETSTGKYGVPSEIASMHLLGKDLAPVRVYDFVGIYPTTLGEITYDIKGNGAPVEFTCTFAYQYWRLKS